MSQGHWLRGLTAVLMSGMLLLLAVGCNEEKDFDPDELFNIEDYAQDQDYALNFVRMMNSWHNSIQEAKGYLETNVEGLTFVESVPPEWSQINPSLRTYPWSILFVIDNNTGEIRPATDEEQWLKNRWHFSSFQDAAYRFISVDQGVPGSATYEPAKVEFMRLNFQTSPITGQAFGIGDSVSVQYVDNFQNPSKLEGSSMFWNADVVQAQSAPSDIASYAGMNNYWGASITNISSSMDNPQGEFDISGFTLLVRADQLEQATLSVSIDASVRQNSRGDGTITVKGEKRAEVVFEYFDTSFHGYYLLSESDFKEPIRF